MRICKILFFATVILVVQAISASAWEVRIHNKCANVNVNVEAEGEHLFWHSTDCSATVGPNKNGNCVLPWGICIRRVAFALSGHSSYSTWRDAPGWIYDNSGSTVPACWNVDYDCSADGVFGTCYCRRR